MSAATAEAVSVGADHRHVSELVRLFEAVPTEPVEEAAKATFHAGCRVFLGVTPDPLASYALAVFARHHGDRSLMEEALRETMRRDPQRASPAFNLGVLMMELGRLEEAESVFLDALARDPELADAANGLGAALYRLGRRDEAEAAFRQALADDPRHDWATGNLAGMLREVGRFHDAEVVYRDALDLTPADPKLCFQFAEMLEVAGRFADAEVAWGDVLACDDFHAAEAACHLGLVLYHQGRLREAEEAFLDAMQRDPEYAMPAHNLGVVLRRLDRLDEAETVYRDAMDRDPCHALAANNLGVLLGHLGRLDEAEAAYGEAMERDPGYGEAAFNLGVLQINQGRFKEAAQSFDTACELFWEAFPKASEGKAVTARRRMRVANVALPGLSERFRADCLLGARDDELAEALEGSVVELDDVLESSEDELLGVSDYEAARARDTFASVVRCRADHRVWRSSIRPDRYPFESALSDAKVDMALAERLYGDGRPPEQAAGALVDSVEQLLAWSLLTPEASAMTLQREALQKAKTGLQQSQIVTVDGGQSGCVVQAALAFADVLLASDSACASGQDWNAAIDTLLGVQSVASSPGMRCEVNAMRAQLTGALLVRVRELDLAASHVQPDELVKAMLEAAEQALEDGGLTYVNLMLVMLEGEQQDGLERFDNAINWRAKRQTLFQTFVQAVVYALEPSSREDVGDALGLAASRRVLEAVLRVRAINDIYQSARLAGVRRATQAIAPPSVDEFIRAVVASGVDWVEVARGLEHLVLVSVCAESGEVRAVLEQCDSEDKPPLSDWLREYDRLRTMADAPSVSGARIDLADMANSLRFSLERVLPSEKRHHPVRVCPEGFLQDLPWTALGPFLGRPVHSQSFSGASMFRAIEAAAQEPTEPALVVVSRQMLIAYELPKWRLGIAPERFSETWFKTAEDKSLRRLIAALCKDGRGPVRLVIIADGANDEVPEPQWMLVGPETCQVVQAPEHVLRPKVVLWLTHGVYARPETCQPPIYLRGHLANQRIGSYELLAAVRGQHPRPLLIGDTVELDLSCTSAFISGACMSGRVDPRKPGHEGVGLVRALQASGVSEVFASSWRMPLEGRTDANGNPRIVAVDILEAAVGAAASGEPMGLAVGEQCRRLHQAGVPMRDWGHAAVFESGVWRAEPRRPST